MQIKNFYTATLLKKFLVGFAVFFVFSCDNYGCVETEDFGEYDSYSFTVYANNLENLCKFDIKKDPSDSTQGVVFRKMYENSPSTTCPKDTNIQKINCGLKVEKLCKINPSLTTEEKTQIFGGVAPKSLSETPWIGIGGSNGIKIEEDSRILINAVGEIKLGENSIKDPAKINDTNKDDFGNPEKNSSKSIHLSINKSEISGNENLFVNFWGKFVSNGTTYLYGADTQYINDLNSNPPQKSISDNRLNYYNDETYSAGAKRILAYFIPFPNSPEIDADKKNISALFPNPKSWNCVLSDNNDNDNIRCSSNAGLNDLDDYVTAEGVETKLLDEVSKKNYKDKYTKLYQVDNLSNNRMYENTGFLRFENDGLVGSANYLDSSSANIIDINLALIPTTFSKYQLQAPASKNYKLKFKKEGVCAGFKFSKDGADGTYEDVFVGSNPILFEVNPNEIDKLYIKTTADNSNSGCTLKAHFYEFLEIPITKSGYVKFDYPVSNIFLNNPSTPFSVTSNVNNCNLNFKIINTHKKPDGSYEYISETTDYTHNFTLKKDDKYFVRKGQKIIFSPESWNGSWSISGNANTFNFQCGKGFYMTHTPRPAVFCSNQKLKELIDINKNLSSSDDCTPYFDPNLKKETGCADDYLKSCAQLYGSGNSINTNFCPVECINFNYFDTNCRPTCGADGLCSAPTNANCNPIINSTYCSDTCSSTPSTCKSFSYYAGIEPYKSQIDPATIVSSLFSQTNCNNCLGIIKNNLTKNFTIKTTNKLTQCYDLEDYTGSLKELNDKIRLINNAPDATAGSSLDPLISLKEKNLKKLGSFNGSYGNLYPLEFVDRSGTTAYSIFRLKTPVFMPNSGYIKYIILNSDYDGDFDFTSTANDKITSSDLNITLESSSSKTNGQNLTIQLCMIGGTDFCSSLTKQNATSITEEDIINTISLPNTRLGLISYGAKYSGLNNYNFDLNGYLYRTTSNRVGDDNFGSSLSECSKDPKSPNASYVGADFMCFRNGGNTNNDLSNNNSYRLSFKIIDDKETLDCLKSNPSSSCSSAPCDGVKAINPNWDGNTPDFCTESEKNQIGIATNSCIKKFICVDRYDNNSGKYDVVIRTKKRSDDNSSRFINSIISPVLGQIDGFDINKDINYQQNQDIQNDILSQNVNYFFNDSNANFLNENNFINDTKINDYKTNKDNKIIGHKFHSSSKGLFEIDLSKVDTDKCSRDNCIISYIAFAGFGKQKQIVANSVYLDKNFKYSDPRIVLEYVRQNCDQKTQCKFPVSFENFGTATNIDKTFSEEPKLLVRYIYSYATQKIKQENLVKRLYNKIANDTNYKRILNLSIVLMFTFYGFGYLIGVSELKQSEIIDRIIKIGIIYLFTNPDFGWIWFEKFFVNGFKTGADFLTFTMASIFDDSGSIENSIRNGIFIDKSPLFSSADNVINLFISNDAVHKKIGALLFYKLFGIIYLIIIYHSIFSYIYAISNAVLLYLTAQVFTSILFMVGPIFFIFILFKQTRSFFDNWINAIIGFALQQIFLIFTLTLFNVLIYNFVKLALSYRVCWDAVWKIDTFAGSIALLRFWTVQDAPSFLNDIQKTNYSGDNNNTTPSLTPMLSLWSLTLIMKSFINAITDLASILAGRIESSALGGGIKGAMNGMLKETASKINKIYEKSGAQKAVQTMDKRLFNSGQLAKNERLNQKKAKVNDKRLAQKINSAGDKAVRDYKINNATEFKNIKDPQEQKNKLQKIKAEAMKNEAKKAGKNDEQIKTMMKEQKKETHSSKTLNTIGSTLKNNDNIFQGIARAVVDRFNPINSLNEKSKNVDTKMSAGDIKKAIEKIDKPEERNDFVKNIKNEKDQGGFSDKQIESFEKKAKELNNKDKDYDN